VGYNFRSRGGWIDFFEGLGLSVVASGPAFDADHPAHFFLLRKARPRRAPGNVFAQSRDFKSRMYAGFERGRHVARLPHVRESPAAPLAAPLLHVGTLHYSLEAEDAEAAYNARVHAGAAP